MNQPSLLRRCGSRFGRGSGNGHGCTEIRDLLGDGTRELVLGVGRRQRIGDGREVRDSLGELAHHLHGVGRRFEVHSGAGSPFAAALAL